MAQLWYSARRGSPQAIEALRRRAEQRRLFILRSTGCEPLAGVPIDGVGGGDLVDGKIALEHAARWPECLDAALDVGPPTLRQLRGGGRLVAMVEGKAADAHAEPSEFDGDIGTAGEVQHRPLPWLEILGALVRIGTNSQRTADMIEHDLLRGEGARQHGQIGDLRMI